MDIPNAVLEAYGLHNTISEVKTFGTGLINHTWKIEAAGKTYILQRINTQVFQEPKAIASNIQSVADYLNQHYPAYFFPAPLLTLDGKEMAYTNEDDGSYYRIFIFVDGSHSKDIVQDATQAYEAAAQFGKFTELLSGFDITALKITLPDFHNLSLR